MRPFSAIYSRPTAVIYQFEETLSNSSNNSRFEVIWNHYSLRDEWNSISLENVKDFAEQKGLCVASIEETEFGDGPMIKAVLLKTRSGNALFPRQKLSEIKLYNKNKEANENYEKFWDSVDWFLPAFIPHGKLFDAISAAGLDVINHKEYQPHELQRRFETSLSSIYDFSNIIPMIQDTFSSSQVIRKHVPLIREAVFAFYSGMKMAAIAALIPIIEDILTQIADSDGIKLDTFNKIDRSIKKAEKNVICIFTRDADWLPNEYLTTEVLKVLSQRVFMLEILKNWLKNSFYKRTDTYNNFSGFNRHQFAHATSDVWQNQSNFFRALGLIQAMAFIECFAVEGNTISLMGPKVDEKSESFYQEILACLNFQVIKKQILEKQQTSSNLPFNSTSSDDGWLQRAAVLAIKMDSIVVVQLREKGWDCHKISDPIKEGEYIIVEAMKQGRSVKVALIYSCASDRGVYQSLDKECDYILYQGETFHLDDFAGHTTAIVRSLNAWIAPT